ncbi:MAG TPA: ribonuclease E/G [Acetobacteraceae bacterium]
MRILGSCSPGEVRVVTLDGAGSEILDFGIWRPGAPDGVGDVHCGRVIARVPAMAGTFIALGAAQGFLPDSEGGEGLGEGDTVSVRVTRAAQGGKGPRLSAAPAGTPPAQGPGVLLELASQYPEAPILVDDGAMAATLRPVLGERLRLAPRAFDPEIEEQVEALAGSDVELAQGARLRIHPTPALVAIDIDLGGALAAGRRKHATHLAANRALLPALARQIRLRNLSGAILVDLAGLPARRRMALTAALSDALAKDPLRPRLLGFTRLGLAEIVRPRVHPPLHELLAGPHAAGLAALRRIAIETLARPHLLPVLRAAPEVVAALQADPEALPDLARRTGRALMMRSDPSVPSARWNIEYQDA